MEMYEWAATHTDQVEAARDRFEVGFAEAELDDERLAA